MNIQTHQTKEGADYYAINPKGNVPALKFSSGVLLNEGSAVLQYLADQNPASKLAPANGTIERYQLQNELNFVATDLHAAGYGPLFAGLEGEVKAKQLAKLANRLKYLDEKILAGGKKNVVGTDLTIVDIYLSVVLSWSGYVGVDLSSYVNINKFIEGIKNDPKVQAAQAALAQASK